MRLLRSVLLELLAAAPDEPRAHERRFPRGRRRPAFGGELGGRNEQCVLTVVVPPPASAGICRRRRGSPPPAPRWRERWRCGVPRSSPAAALLLPTRPSPPKLPRKPPPAGGARPVAPTSIFRLGRLKTPGPRSPFQRSGMECPTKTSSRETSAQRIPRSAAIALPAPPGSTTQALPTARPAPAPPPTSGLPRLSRRHHSVS